MRESRVGYWLQVGANVGILAGLILVFAQIRQSNQITGAELFSDSLESTVARDLALIGETPEQSMTRLLLDPASVTPQDQFVADRVYMAIWRQLNRALLLSEAGLYGTNENIDASGFIYINHPLFACPYGLAWLDDLQAQLEADNVQYRLLGRLRQLAERRLATERFADHRAAAERIRLDLERLRQGGA